MLCFSLLLMGQAFAIPGPPGGLNEELWKLALGAHPSQLSPQPDLRKYELYVWEAVRQFPPVTITASTSSLSPPESQVLGLLVRAARLMDPIFNRQVWRGYSDLREELASDTSKLGQAKLQYFDIMRGPWDRQDHDRPFAVSTPKPLGAGFYPPTMTVEEWEEYVGEHPEDAERLGSLVTMVERGDYGGLVATNYSQYFRDELSSASSLMEEAANITENQSLRRFLLSRAAAFLSDDYYQSDKDWMDLDSRIEITIGPYEVYEDKLKGQKASFVAFITMTDPKESEKLSFYKSLLPQMNENLPIPDSMKYSRGSESPIRVVDLLLTTGDARQSIQVPAFNLPNDERVRKEKGAKKMILRNTLAAKYQSALEPLARTLMKKKQLAQNLLSSDVYFNIVLFHELSHSLGPGFVGNDESQGDIRSALGGQYNGLEEAKADVMGIYNILFMIERGIMPKDMENKVLFTYTANLLRLMRFGVTDAHGKAAALQLNRFLEEGAVQHLDTEGTYQVNFNKLKESVTSLVRDICTWQHNGDKAAVDRVMEEYGTVGETVQDSLDTLTEVPVDFTPCYPVAGEDCSAAATFKDNFSR